MDRDITESEEELMASSAEKYDDLMTSHFSSFQLAEELEQFHLQTRHEILLELPSDLNPFVADEIDDAYAVHKRRFDRFKSLDASNELIQVALKHYTEQMDTAFENKRDLGRNDALTAHNAASTAAIKLFKDSKQSSVASLEKLKSRLEGCFQRYKSRAEMTEKAKTDPAIGIDLGTTMCCVTVFHNGKIEVIPNRPQGNSNTTPSYVGYPDDESDTFGSVAKEEAHRYPETTIYDAKRLIGRYWTDDILQNDRNHWPFEVIEEQGQPKIQTWGQTRYPHEISARLLTQFRIMADEYLGLPVGSVTKAVITVPAYFSEPQRRATAEAGECAGLDVLNILSEPTAAAIAYSWERREQNEKRKALIYDLGGGTFDVAVAAVEAESVEILAVDGDTHLGGQDFDQLLMDYCIRELRNKENIDLLADKYSDIKQKKDKARSSLARLKFQCEKTKERLTCSEKQTVNVERVHDDKHMAVEVTREKFDELVRPLVQKTIDIVDGALEQVKSKGIQKKSDIDDVILVGGSTRIPLVATMLKDYFEGKNLCKYIDPDVTVAYGAAVQAAILNNADKVSQIKVEDVTPMTLGTDVGVDGVSVLIQRNSKIPCEVTKEYCFPEDFKTDMRFKIFQGESLKASENKLLGEFFLDGFPAKPAGEEEAVATMKIDKNGLLSISAVAKSTGKAEGITIKSDRLAMSKDDMTEIKQKLLEAASQHI